MAEIVKYIFSVQQIYCVYAKPTIISDHPDVLFKTLKFNVMLLIN